MFPGYALFPLPPTLLLSYLCSYSLTLYPRPVRSHAVAKVLRLLCKMARESTRTERKLETCVTFEVSLISQRVRMYIFTNYSYTLRRATIHRYINLFFSFVSEFCDYSFSYENSYTFNGALNLS